MAEDFTLVFLAELVVGLALFCAVSAYTYARIKRFKKGLGQLSERMVAIESRLHSCRDELHAVRHASASYLSDTELEHSLHLFSLYVLHHVPSPNRRGMQRHQPIKTRVRKQ